MGYPMLVYAMVKLKSLAGWVKQSVYTDGFEPEVSLVVPCFNEEQTITEKLQNCFELDYPATKLKLIFITDGSDDGTQQILANTTGVMVLHEDLRAGKSVAENRAMKHVHSPIVVFSDANTRLNKAAIREIVKHYQDERIGAVAGEKRIISKQRESAPAAGEGFYWKYESYLKKLDSSFHSVVGGAGELVSFRSSLFTPLEADTILDDFVQTMRIALAGYRVVYEPNAYAQETASATVKEELKRKVRISAGAWQAMTRLGNAFNPFKNPQLFFLFISHKVFRWTLAPLALLLLIPVTFYLHQSNAGIYTLAWYAQLVFYVFTIIGWFLEHRKLHSKFIFIPYYFFMTNWCMYLGFFRFVSGGQSVQWERVKREAYKH